MYTEQMTLKTFIENLDKVIFTGLTERENMTEKECNNHFDYIIIICQTLIVGSDMMTIFGLSNQNISYFNGNCHSC